MTQLSKKTIAIFLLATTPLLADDLGGEVAIGGWNHAPSGWVRFPNDIPLEINKVDIESDLFLDSDTDLYLRAKLEHPIPLLPNLRLDYSEVQTSADGIATRPFHFGRHVKVDVGDTVHSEVDLTNLDFTLYYEVLDNDTLQLDLGVTLRYFDASFRVGEAASKAQATANVNTPFPMLYVDARLTLPFAEGLSIGANGFGFSYDGSSVYDFSADLRYTFMLGLGLEAGYRTQSIQLDDVDHVDADLTFQGFFAGVLWDF